MLQERYYPANSIGLGFVTNKECYKTVLNLGDHHLVNNGNSLILLTKSENGGLQTINGENELNSIDHTRSITLSKEELEDYLFKKNMDNLDLDCLYIYEEKNLVSKYSFKTVVQLFTPPIYKLILNKIKALFFIKRE